MTDRSNKTCEWVAERTDAFLEGELETADSNRLQEHANGCGDCREEIEFARRVTSELRSLPSLECPEAVVDAAARQVRQTRPTFADKLRDMVDRQLDAFMKPAVAVMVVLIVAIGVYVLTQRDAALNGTQTAAEPTQQEIETAARDAMIAFAYVGKFSKQTGYLFRDEVLGQRVVPTVRRAMTTATKASQGAEKPKE